MSLGLNGNIGNNYITQNEWNKKWEKEPYELIELIKTTLYDKLDPSNQRTFRNLENTLTKNINLELIKLKELAQAYAESG